MTSADAERRLQFLISEANQPDPIYDQTVRMAFRVVSNFYCIGRDGGSADVYKLSRYRSEKAHDLIKSRASAGKILNEHQEPIKAVWDGCVLPGSRTLPPLPLG